MRHVETVGTCDTCGDKLVHWRQWDVATPAERAELRRAGYNRKRHAGQCHRCKMAEYRATLPEPAESSRYTRRELLEEWERFGNDHEPLMTQCRRLAPRLGMKPTSLEKALRRAGVVSSFAMGGTERKTAA